MEQIELEQVNRLIGYIVQLEDPRRDLGKKHLLVDVIVIAVLATIASCDDWEEMEDFATEREEWLRKFLLLPNGIPSHDTIRRVFLLLRPEVIKGCFLSWLSELSETTPGEVVAIDGKTLRGSRDGEKLPLHIVNVWATERNILLGQEAVAEKSNEIVAIPEVLETLNIKGAIVTCDAMGCQRDIAAKIREREADYLLVLKENQPTLLNDVKELLEEKKAQNLTDFYETVEKGHGRLETRRCYSTSDVFVLGAEKHWKDLRSVALIESVREIKGKVATDTRYFLSSLSGESKQIAEAARKHWEIENRLHWSLDVTFREDASRTRATNAAENLSFLRKLALSLLKNESTSKKSLKHKRFISALNPDFLLKVLQANFNKVENMPKK